MVILVVVASSSRLKCFRTAAGGDLADFLVVCESTVGISTK